MQKPQPLISKPFGEMNKEEFFAVIKALYKNPNSKASTTVPGISLSVGKKTIVRITREDKRITEHELALLAGEHDLDASELMLLFTKRKINVVNENGDILNVRAPKRRAKARKRNDVVPATDEWQAES